MMIMRMTFKNVVSQRRRNILQLREPIDEENSSFVGGHSVHLLAIVRPNPDRNKMDPSIPRLPHLIQGLARVDVRQSLRQEDEHVTGIRSVSPGPLEHGVTGDANRIRRIGESVAVADVVDGSRQVFGGCVGVEVELDEGAGAELEDPDAEATGLNVDLVEELLQEVLHLLEVDFADASGWIKDKDDVWFRLATSMIQKQYAYALNYIYRIQQENNSLCLIY